MLARKGGGTRPVQRSNCWHQAGSGDAQREADMLHIGKDFFIFYFE
jgi:hypothetical protein